MSTSRIRPISHYMTPMPHSIGRQQPLSRAHQVMREHGIRHLPVLEGGRLIGMLSMRDLQLIETLAGVDPEAVPVEEAMSSDPYSVSPSTPIDAVAATMAEHKYGSAVIIDESGVVGMFTTVDACRALVDLLRGR